ncbi:MAG: hypothetical protein WBP44_14195 [Gammaproteobacteria bacterium]|jgi:hypothetical protein
MTNKDLNRGWIRDVSYEEFEREVLQVSQQQPVLVDFRAGCGLLLILFAGLPGVALPTQSLAATSEATPSAIEQLARVLQDSPLPMRSDFAWLALTQMAGFYLEEADRARMESRNTPRAHDAMQWAASVEDYARKITLLADSITSATAITISVGVDNSVQIYVERQPVILSGAISGQQSVYEQRVLERFCVLYSCEDLLPALDIGARELAAASTSTDEATAYWSFSQHAGPVCMTNDGLEFQFQQMTGLGEKREACTRAVAELGELAGAMVREQQQGVRIDWDGLQVLPAAADEPQRVRLAARVEIRLQLPMLAEHPELLRIVRPWLKARVRGESYSLVVLNAGRLMGLDDSLPAEPDTQRYPAFSIVHE